MKQWSIELIGLGYVLRCLFKPRYHYRADGKAKIDYQTAETARKAAQEMSSQTGKQFDWYRCRKCHGWHVGKDAAL